jgi:hypothetical protein
VDSSTSVEYRMVLEVEKIMLSETLEQRERLRKLVNIILMFSGHI